MNSELAALEDHDTAKVRSNPEIYFDLARDRKRLRSNSHEYSKLEDRGLKSKVSSSIKSKFTQNTDKNEVKLAPFHSNREIIYKEKVELSSDLGKANNNLRKPETMKLNLGDKRFKILNKLCLKEEEMKIKDIFSSQIDSNNPSSPVSNAHQGKVIGENILNIRVNKLKTRNNEISSPESDYNKYKIKKNIPSDGEAIKDFSQILNIYNENTKNKDESVNASDMILIKGMNDNSVYNVKTNNKIEFNESCESLSRAICRICFENDNTEENPLIFPCTCRGSSKFVHDKCLKKQFLSKENFLLSLEELYKTAEMKCEICQYEFITVPITINECDSDKIKNTVKTTSYWVFLVTIFFLVLIFLLYGIGNSELGEELKNLILKVLIGALFFFIVLIILIQLRNIKENCYSDRFVDWSFKNYDIKEIVEAMREQREKNKNANSNNMFVLGDSQVQSELM